VGVRIVTDEHLRDLERKAAFGSVTDEASWLVERLRSGALSKDRLRLAAFVGSAAARLALGSEAPESPLGPTLNENDYAALCRCVAGLEPFGRETWVRAAVAAAEGVAAETGLTRKAELCLDAARAWIRCPCDQHARETAQVVADQPADDDRSSNTATRAAMAVAGEVREAGTALAYAHQKISPVALYRAVTGDLAAWALDQGDPVSETRSRASPSASVAAVSGDADGLRALLTATPAAVNEADKDGLTPLFLAVLNRRVECVRVLLAAGARTDVQRRYSGGMPLHAACGPTSFRREADRMVPLGECVPEIARLLLEAGADRDAPGYMSKTPLHMAAEAGWAPVARLLLDASAPVDTPGYLGGTPLHLAAAGDHRETAALLLERGASPLARNRQGLTPSEAAPRGSETRRLLEEAATRAQATTPRDPWTTPIRRLIPNPRLGVFVALCAEELILGRIGRDRAEVAARVREDRHLYAGVWLSSDKLLVAGDEGSLTLHSGGDLARERTVSLPRAGSVTELALSPDGRRVAVGALGGLWLLDAESLAVVSHRRGGEATCLSFDPKGSFLAVGETDDYGEWAQLTAFPISAAGELGQGIPLEPERGPHEERPQIDAVVFEPDGEALTIHEHRTRVRRIAYKSESGRFATTNVWSTALDIRDTDEAALGRGDLLRWADASLLSSGPPGRVVVLDSATGRVQREVSLPAETLAQSFARGGERLLVASQVGLLVVSPG
jgi:ankyrin repeat protein